MSEDVLRQILEELRRLRSEVRALTGEVRKLVRNAEDAPGCPECGGELTETSTMAGKRQTCSLCGKSYAVEVLSG